MIPLEVILKEAQNGDREDFVSALHGQSSGSLHDKSLPKGDSTNSRLDNSLEDQTFENESTLNYPNADPGNVHMSIRDIDEDVNKNKILSSMLIMKKSVDDNSNQTNDVLGEVNPLVKSKENSRKTTDPTEVSLQEDVDEASFNHNAAKTDSPDVGTDSKSNENQLNLSIAEFYKDKHILVTGSTGFVGQAVVAKLLRSCPGIRRITLPIRVFERKCLLSRFEDLVKNEVLALALAEGPDMKNKLVPVRVQYDDKQLGFSDDEYTSLARDVDVIVHGAASTRLVDPVPVAIQDNVTSTQHVLRFAQRCDKLKAFVYVSTAFSQLWQDFIPESVPTQVTAEHLFGLAERYPLPRYYNPKKMYDRIGAPCAYMFSKRVAEHVVSECTELPRVIARPCIISSAVSDPYGGWTSGYVGFNGFMRNLSRKFYRYLPGKKDNAIEIIPVDLTANTLISAAWFVGTGRDQGTLTDGSPLVLNIHSSNANALTVKTFIQYLNEYYEQRDHSSFRIKRTSSRAKSSFVAAMRHFIPSLFRDLVTLKICHRRCESSRVRNQILAVHMMSYQFEEDRLREYTNCDRIRAEMSEDDCQVFNTDPRTIQWREYVFRWMDACRAVDEKKK